MKDVTKVILFILGGLIVSAAIVVGFLFAADKNDLFGKESAKSFLHEFFNQNKEGVIAYIDEAAMLGQENIVEKIEDIMEYYKSLEDTNGQYTGVSFYSLSKTGSEVTLKGTMRFENGNAPICIMQAKVNDAWKIYYIRPVCPVE